MNMKLPTRHLLLFSSIFLLAACGAKKVTAPVMTDGARSAILSIDQLMAGAASHQTIRPAALLGIFVSEYISFSVTATAAQGALTGVAVDHQITDAQTTVTDPDFDLLQAFADALQVDTADLLNRSTDRQQTLDAYTTSLTNVATRANQRFKELSGADDQLKETSRAQAKELSAAERDLKNAVSKKQFGDAGELQKTVLEKQQAFGETDLKRKQTENVIDTLGKMLTLYGQKILAIQQNREVLIAGNRVVDVPGIEELQIIQRQKGSTRATGNHGAQFDTLFQGSGLK